MNHIDTANSACATSNQILRVDIYGTKQAIQAMKDMRSSGEVPAACMDELNAHIDVLRDNKRALKQMLNDRKQTCKILTKCLEDHDIIITPQDGGK